MGRLAVTQREAPSGLERQRGGEGRACPRLPTAPKQIRAGRALDGGEAVVVTVDEIGRSTGEIIPGMGLWAHGGRIDALPRVLSPGQKLVGLTLEHLEHLLRRAALQHRGIKGSVCLEGRKGGRGRADGLTAVEQFAVDLNGDPPCVCGHQRVSRNWIRKGLEPCREMARLRSRDNHATAVPQLHAINLGVVESKAHVVVARRHRLTILGQLSTVCQSVWRGVRRADPPHRNSDYERGDRCHVASCRHGVLLEDRGGNIRYLKRLIVCVRGAGHFKAFAPQCAVRVCDDVEAPISDLPPRLSAEGAHRGLEAPSYAGSLVASVVHDTVAVIVFAVADLMGVGTHRGIAVIAVDELGTLGVRRNPVTICVEPWPHTDAGLAAIRLGANVLIITRGIIAPGLGGAAAVRFVDNTDHTHSVEVGAVDLWAWPV